MDARDDAGRSGQPERNRDERDGCDVRDNRPLWDDSLEDEGRFRFENRNPGGFIYLFSSSFGGEQEEEVESMRYISYIIRKKKMGRIFIVPFHGKNGIRNYAILLL